MTSRIIQKNIVDRLHSGKALLIEGPRQVGKTTLIHSLLSSERCLFFNGDELTDRGLN